MPVQPDLRALKNGAKQLMRTARVPVPRMMLLWLGIDLLLSEISTALSCMLDDSIGIASFSFSFAGIFVALLSTVLLAGFAIYCLGVQSGREMPFDSLFDAFPFAGQVILLTLAQGLLIALGFILFVVPGVVLAFSYAFSLYYLCEDPDAGVIEALRRSRLALQGYKWSLFELTISFRPRVLLVAVPIGICRRLLRGVFAPTLGGQLLETLIYGVLAGCASVYLTPYMALSQVGFYRFVSRADAPEPPKADGSEK